MKGFKWLLVAVVLAVSLSQAALPLKQLGSTGVAEAGATGITITGQECLSTDRVRVSFQWNPTGQGPQWLDLSLFNNNFAPDTFIGLGPVPAGQNTFVWDGLLDGLTHFFRINTLTSNGWDPSQTVFFTTISCDLQRAATDLHITAQECLPDGRVRVDFAWDPSGQGSQWLDLTLHNNNFAPNTFISSGGMPSGQATLRWDGLLPGLTHFFRVNTLTSAGWFPSATVSFTTSQCGPAAATNLHVVEQECEADGDVAVTLAWNPSGGGAQWVDVSTSNSFAPGTFTGFGGFPSTTSTLVVPNLEEDDRYFVRVNTLTAGGWATSQTLSFDAIECTSEYTTTDKSVTATGTDQTVLDDVRVAAHAEDGFDRIVFEFDGPIPAATIGYETSAAQCGSGNPVDPAGGAILVITMQNAVAHVDGSTTAPTQVSGTGESILEAISTCDFEGVVQYAIGIDEVRGFRVTTLTEPNRIVIDVLR